MVHGRHECQGESSAKPGAGNPDPSTCSADEHMRIIEALDAGDLHAALVAMHEHLSELEARVVAQVRKRAAEEDLGAVLGV
ncbi:FCD domain-containing protein [Paraburkholderia sp.]|uniref:FCD domain-containing protein n=1 Tax=Paraburkholderia sp. TaxID=1926495 RepID=UPI002AFF1243|nr:FCD domain-containing protein [Paraburkholderia sp.]